MTAWNRLALLALVLAATRLGEAVAAPPASERYALKHTALSAPAPISANGRYRLEARLSQPDPAKQPKRTQGFELRGQVKSLSSTCGALADPLFVDGYE